MEINCLFKFGYARSQLHVKVAAEGRVRSMQVAWQGKPKHQPSFIFIAAPYGKNEVQEDFKN